MIAMALACNPKLLIADEPTTALDVTIQAQIMDLMQELQEKIDTAIILITHDLGVVAEHGRPGGGDVRRQDRGDRRRWRTSSTQPPHPYTWALLNSHAHGWTRTGRAAGVHRRHAARPASTRPRAAPLPPAARYCMKICAGGAAPRVDRGRGPRGILLAAASRLCPSAEGRGERMATNE